MYILSEYKYDYYEFRNPVAVSQDEDQLWEYINKEKDHPTVAKRESTHKKYAEQERTHYYVEKIKEI